MSSEKQDWGKKLYAGALIVQKEKKKWGFSSSQDYVHNKKDNAVELAKMNAKKKYRQKEEKLLKEAKKKIKQIVKQYPHISVNLFAKREIYPFQYEVELVVDKKDKKKARKVKRELDTVIQEYNRTLQETWYRILIREKGNAKALSEVDYKTQASIAAGSEDKEKRKHVAVETLGRIQLQKILDKDKKKQVKVNGKLVKVKDVFWTIGFLYWLLGEKKAFNTICGKQKTGKTQYALSIAEQGKKLGFIDKVATNVDTDNHFKYVQNFQDFKAWVGEHRWEQKLFIVDEADEAFGARRGMKEKHVQVTRWVNQMAKRFTKVIMVTHEWKDIDRRFRDKTTTKIDKFRKTNVVGKTNTIRENWWALIDPRHTDYPEIAGDVINSFPVCDIEFDPYSVAYFYYGETEEEKIGKEKEKWRKKAKQRIKQRNILVKELARHIPTSRMEEMLRKHGVGLSASYLRDLKNKDT